jgi:bisphosphoglycerate-dependent phosphoglycerate mutase
MVEEYGEKMRREAAAKAKKEAAQRAAVQAAFAKQASADKDWEAGRAGRNASWRSLLSGADNIVDPKLRQQVKKELAGMGRAVKDFENLSPRQQKSALRRARQKEKTIQDAKDRKFIAETRTKAQKQAALDKRQARIDEGKAKRDQQKSIADAKRAGKVADINRKKVERKTAAINEAKAKREAKAMKAAAERNARREAAKQREAARKAEIKRLAEVARANRKAREQAARQAKKNKK